MKVAIGKARFLNYGVTVGKISRGKVNGHHTLLGTDKIYMTLFSCHPVTLGIWY